MKAIYLSLLFILFFSACTEKPKVFSRAQLIDQEIEKKLNIIRTKRFEACKQEALEEAISYIDSLIAKEFSLTMVDTIQFPFKPHRPNIPGGKIKLDTSSIDPIIKK